MHGQRAGNGDALLLAAGKLVRIGVDLVQQADLDKQVMRPRPSFFFREAAYLDRGKDDVFLHRHVRKQVEALKHHANFRTQCVDICMVVMHRDAVNQHAPAGGFFQAVQAAQESTFARAGRADDADNFGIVYRTVDAAQHL